MIICRLRYGSFEKSSLAEFGCDAHSFARDREGCCVGGPYHTRAVLGGAGGAWERPVLKTYTMVLHNSNERPDPNDDDHDDDASALV